MKLEEPINAIERLKRSYQTKVLVVSFVSEANRNEDSFASNLPHLEAGNPILPSCEYQAVDYGYNFTTIGQS